MKKKVNKRCPLQAECERKCQHEGHFRGLDGAGGQHMKKEELKSILDKHLKWLRGEEGGERANLTGADLTGANLAWANLAWANLTRANLTGADLTGADLTGANLAWANLTRANLARANLADANLTGANLTGANLTDANLARANLAWADNVDAATWSIYIAFYPMQCPEHGAYTAFKKARGLIVELEIPADALRSSATSRKCRASKAKVISISDEDGNPAGEQVESDYDKNFIYIVGQTVEVLNFDANRWNECAPGIHHYITRAEAVKHR